MIVLKTRQACLLMFYHSSMYFRLSNYIGCFDISSEFSRETAIKLRFPTFNKYCLLYSLVVLWSVRLVFRTYENSNISENIID